MHIDHTYCCIHRWLDDDLSDYSELYRLLYDEIETYSNGKIAECILAIAEGQYQDVQVVDKEINFMSTIVKLIMGKLEPISGDCRNNRQARIALFTQYHMDQLNLEQSAVEFLCERFANDKEMMAQKDKTGYARRRLGRFKLTGKQHTQN